MDEDKIFQKFDIEVEFDEGYSFGEQIPKKYMI